MSDIADQTAEPNWLKDILSEPMFLLGITLAKKIDFFSRWIFFKNLKKKQRRTLQLVVI